MLREAFSVSVGMCCRWTTTTTTMLCASDDCHVVRGVNSDSVCITWAGGHTCSYVCVHVEWILLSRRKRNHRHHLCVCYDGQRVGIFKYPPLSLSLSLSLSTLSLTVTCVASVPLTNNVHVPSYQYTHGQSLIRRLNLHSVESSIVTCVQSTRGIVSKSCL